MASCGGTIIEERNGYCGFAAKNCFWNIRSFADEQCNLKVIKKGIRMVMRKITGLLCLLLVAAFVLSGCGNPDKTSMSLEEIAESVMYNPSMVGVGKEMTDNIRNIISFLDDDEMKMRYLTNNVYFDDCCVSENITIVRGIYYDSFLNLKGTDYARAAVIFVEFENAEAATAAAAAINEILNLESSADGTISLTFGEAVSKKNVVCIIATHEVNMYLELKRVFLDNSYVR